MLTNVAVRDRLGVVLRRVWAELPRHLAVNVPLAWRGMNQNNPIPYGSLCRLPVILGLARGTHRNRSVPAALAFCPFVILGINSIRIHRHSPIQPRTVDAPVGRGRTVRRLGRRRRMEQNASSMGTSARTTWRPPQRVAAMTRADARAELRIRAAGKRAGLRLNEVWAIFPPLRLRLRRADGPLAGLIGSSFVAVFRMQAGP